MIPSDELPEGVSQATFSEWAEDILTAVSANYGNAEHVLHQLIELTKMGASISGLDDASDLKAFDLGKITKRLRALISEPGVDVAQRDIYLQAFGAMKVLEEVVFQSIYLIENPDGPVLEG